MRITNHKPLPINAFITKSSTTPAHFGSSSPPSKPAFTDREFMRFLQTELPEPPAQQTKQGWGFLKSLGAANEPAKATVAFDAIAEWILQKLGYCEEELEQDDDKLFFYYDAIGVLERLQAEQLIEKVNLGYSIALGGTTSSDPYTYGYRLTAKGYNALNTKT